MKRIAVVFILSVLLGLPALSEEFDIKDVKGLKKVKCPPAAAVFAASALGDLGTYVVTSLQLGVVWGNTLQYMSIFAVTQVPLAIAEGLLTVVVFNVLEKYSAAELRELSVM